MTTERASELVIQARQTDRDLAIELFAHFVETLKIDSTFFARLCGYPIATNVSKVD